MSSNLRDDFAKRAMQAMIKQPKKTLWSKLMGLLGVDSFETTYIDPETIAQVAYEYADAMIAERNKTKD